MIQSAINRTPVDKAPELPMLMINDAGDTIILVNHIGNNTMSAMCVASSIPNTNLIGYYSVCWDIKSYRPFLGEIKLRNA